MGIWSQLLNEPAVGCFGNHFDQAFLTPAQRVGRIDDDLAGEVAELVGDLFDEQTRHGEHHRVCRRGRFPRRRRAGAVAGAGYELAAHEHRLRFILRGRELGFSIEDIRGLLTLVDCHAVTCADVQKMTLHHLADVRARIADLRLERMLAATVAAYSGGDVPECPVLDALAGGRSANAS